MVSRDALCAFKSWPGRYAWPVYHSHYLTPVNCSWSPPLAGPQNTFRTRFQTRQPKFPSRFFHCFPKIMLWKLFLLQFQPWSSSVVQPHLPWLASCIPQQVVVVWLFYLHLRAGCCCRLSVQACWAPLEQPITIGKLLLQSDDCT